LALCASPVGARENRTGCFEYFDERSDIRADIDKDVVVAWTFGIFDLALGRRDKLDTRRTLDAHREIVQRREPAGRY
jgi:hypothetical protein